MASQVWKVFRKTGEQPAQVISGPKHFKVIPTRQHALTQILFGPGMGVLPFGGIIPWQIYVVDVDDHPALHLAEGAQVKEDTIVPKARFGAGVYEKKIARLQRLKMFQGFS